MTDTVRPRPSVGGVDIRVNKAEATSPAGGCPARQSPASPDDPLLEDVSKERLQDRIASLEEDIRITQILGSSDEHARRLSEYRARLEELQQRLGDNAEQSLGAGFTEGDDADSAEDVTIARALGLVGIKYGDPPPPFDPHKFALAMCETPGLDLNAPNFESIWLALELGRVAPKKFPAFVCHWPEVADYDGDVDQAFNHWVQDGWIRTFMAAGSSERKAVKLAYAAIPKEHLPNREPEKAPKKWVGKDAPPWGPLRTAYQGRKKERRPLPGRIRAAAARNNILRAVHARLANLLRRQ